MNYLQNNHRQIERNIQFEAQPIEIQRNKQNEETKRKINKNKNEIKKKITSQQV